MAGGHDASTAGDPVGRKAAGLGASVASTAPRSRGAVSPRVPGPPRAEWRVVLPVLDEAAALPGLLAEMAAVPGLLERAVFVDNGSTDGSAALIEAAGGLVVREERRGYGLACLAGVEAASALGAGEVGVIAFMEADGSDDPADLPRLLAPVLAGDVDLLVGSRRRAVRAGAPMPPHQRWGNAAAVLGMRALFGVSLPDNGPYRAIRLDLLEAVHMEPRGYAWTTEMVVKAHLRGARVSWVETDYRARAGRSKISGTVRGTVGAFRGIFGTLLRLRLRGGVRQ